MSAVEVSHAVKRFGSVAALHDVSVDFADGEFFGLLGPSGSGKTTLLRAIAGFFDLDAGDIRIGGVPVGDRPVHRREIGMVFQNYALFPHLTVRDNIGFGLAVRGRPRSEIDAEVKRMLALVQLSGRETRKPRQLTGGQQQRVALARALAPSPSVLLLDEPMAALDKQLREAMQLEVKGIQSEVGVTTVSVTHDQTEAMTMSDRVAIMRDGLIEQLDTPEALYRRPATLFAARFLGEANLLPVAEGRIVGFGVEVAAREGTAVVRPEDLTVGVRARPGAPRITARVRAASFQGSRYRVEFEHDPVGRLVASLPPEVSPLDIAPGLEVELACTADTVHAIATEAPAPERRADLAGA
jgi:putative spermidine/putrescine transport system ATP-binding protein